MGVTQELRQEFLQEGLQQGIQLGIQTRNVAIAKNMLFQLHLGMDIVQQATGLSREELERLQAEAK